MVPVVVVVVVMGVVVVADVGSVVVVVVVEGEMEVVVGPVKVVVGCLAWVCFVCFIFLQVVVVRLRLLRVVCVRSRLECGPVQLQLLVVVVGLGI